MLRLSKSDYDIIFNLIYSEERSKYRLITKTVDNKVYFNTASFYNVKNCRTEKSEKIKTINNVIYSHNLLKSLEDIRFYDGSIMCLYSDFIDIKDAGEEAALRNIIEIGKELNNLLFMNSFISMISEEEQKIFKEKLENLTNKFNTYVLLYLSYIRSFEASRLSDENYIELNYDNLLAVMAQRRSDGKNN